MLNNRKWIFFFFFNYKEGSCSIFAGCKNNSRYGKGKSLEYVLLCDCVWKVKWVLALMLLVLSLRRHLRCVFESDWEQRSQTVQWR